MDATQSSCEMTSRPAPAASGSRVLRCAGGFRWPGVPVVEYKEAAAHHRGVARVGLVGEQGEATAFHLRYFEIAPGGFTSLEKHVHEHAVVVLCGSGEVQLGPSVHRLGPGDVVYVGPEEVHQFRNPSPSAPFGFL